MFRLSREITRYINQNNHIVQNIIPLIDNNTNTDNFILLIIGIASITLITYIIQNNNQITSDNKEKIEEEIEE
jgi:hypothetical protein